MGISKEWCNALLNINIEKPTSVQSRVIPLLLAGKNVLFKSETGTGKTFAYLLPMVQRIASEEKTGGVKAVILSPTYELSSQIKAQLQKISAMKSALLIGGAPIKRQIESLKEKPAVVIGSVGRITELLRLKKLKTDNLEWV
ncbi:MAG: DEAD/DEAH box helicase, partial [Spirochaetaceae bacterium]|nr:DEAD/DEAH box helicase [Spirochaetaceae bacterium]